jgi:hypothetical protein
VARRFSTLAAANAAAKIQAVSGAISLFAENFPSNGLVLG